MGILMRAGEEATQKRALARIDEMYDSGSEDFVRGNVVWHLSWFRSPQLAPFFARVIRESPQAHLRLIAATSLLAAEAGVLPE